MLQSFECPNCQATLDYDAQAEAITIRCSFCNSTVIVPDSMRSRRGQPARQPEILAQVVQLVQNGRKIEAIKLFRETFNVGLKEAKDVVDAIERHEDIHLGGTNFHTAAVTVTSFDKDPMVQTRSGQGGCAALVVGLLVLAIGAAAFLAIIPVGSITIFNEILQGVQAESESRAETGVSGNDPIIIITTLEAIMPNQEEASSEPGFAEQVMQIGGEEGLGPGFFSDTRRLSIDGDGNIYVGDYSGGRIQVFSETGDFLATWNAGESLYLGGMTADRSGTVYIINITEVEKYNGLTGEFLGTLELPGGSSTYFKTAATGPDGSVYLIGEDRLVRLDRSGGITLDLADPFANIPDFSTTYFDAAIDGAGNIIVLGDEAVYKLNGQGQYLDQFGSRGDAEDQFRTPPTAVAVDGKGRIFVNDFDGIKVFDANGRYLSIIGFRGVAFDMVFTDENELLVMDRNNNSILKYHLNE